MLDTSTGKGQAGQAAKSQGASIDLDCKIIEYKVSNEKMKK